jgi:hypothetical protein
MARENVFGGAAFVAYQGKLTTEQIEDLDNCASVLSTFCLPTREDPSTIPATIDGYGTSLEYLGRQGRLALVRVNPKDNAERRGLEPYNDCMCKLLKMHFARTSAFASVSCP